MGSTSAENNNGSDYTGAPGVGRRDLIKRSAALGLIAVPTMSFLSACASGGGDDSSSDDSTKGTTSKSNPFGVKKGSTLDVVVFKGGYGDDYAKAWEANFKTKIGVSSTHTGTQEITGKLQPRFNAGNPPDIVDDSGAQQIKIDVLYKNGQLLDLSPVLDAPAIDDPTKKVRDLLIPGTLDPGVQEGKVVALNYIYTVWGLWYSGKLFKDKGWTPPKTWDEFIAICQKAKAAGIGGLAHQGKYPYYINVAIMDLIAKKGGIDAVKAIDNLDPKAFVGSAAAQAGVEAIYEVVEKGLLMPGTNGLTHTESQTRWNQYKAAFITCGSWLENEQLKLTPDGLRHEVPADAAAARQQDAVRGDPGRLRRALHHPGEGQEPPRRQGVHAPHALQGVVDALRQGGQLAHHPQGRCRLQRHPAPGHPVHGRGVQGGRRQHLPLPVPRLVQRDGHLHPERVQRADGQAHPAQGVAEALPGRRRQAGQGPGVQEERALLITKA
jgi:carbohydrate ABC transporter N-acetylglucosamine/diacetylchitobiose-binding protein